MPALVVRLPQGDTRAVQLSGQPVTIGRAEQCDLCLPSDEVSREHARVWVDEVGRVLVADLRSKNGTRVDAGDVFRNAVRAAAQSIRVGDFEIRVVGAAPPAGPPIGVRFQQDQPTAAGQASFFPSSRRLDLNQQRLALLMSLTERIGGAFERKQLLQQALDACCDTLGFERGLIALKTQRGDTEVPVTRNVRQDASGAYTISRTLINRALIHGERAVVNNPALDLGGNISDSLVRFPICSALCVPIIYRDETLGVIYGDRVTQASTYTAEDVDFLAAIAQQVGVGLTNLRLFARHLEMQKVVEELTQARAIQQRLLPAVPLAAGRVVLAGYNEPSSAVGGDYFDYFRLSDGRIGMIIADVTGHGLPAALLMANLQAAVHVGMTANVSLPDLAARLNGLICTNTGANVFITAILARLDPQSGTLEYINAGHPDPLLLHRGQARCPDDEHSLPFGIEPDEPYRVQRIESAEELDAVLFYTDGLVEAANPDGQLLDITPIANALAAVPEPTTDAILHTTLAVVREHLSSGRHLDDLTLMAVQYLHGTPGAHATRPQ